MICNTCNLPFDESDLSQVFEHEHKGITAKKNIGKILTHKVVSIIFKDNIPFKGLEYECYEFIERTYGNGFKAIMFKVEKL